MRKPVVPRTLKKYKILLKDFPKVVWFAFCVGYWIGEGSIRLKDSYTFFKVYFQNLIAEEKKWKS